MIENESKQLHNNELVLEHEDKFDKLEKGLENLTGIVGELVKGINEMVKWQDKKDVTDEYRDKYIDKLEKDVEANQKNVFSMNQTVGMTILGAFLGGIGTLVVSFLILL